MGAARGAGVGPEVGVGGEDCWSWGLFWGMAKVDWRVAIHELYLETGENECYHLDSTHGKEREVTICKQTCKAKEKPTVHSKIVRN